MRRPLSPIITCKRVTHRIKEKLTVSYSTFIHGIYPTFTDSGFAFTSGNELVQQVQCNTCNVIYIYNMSAVDNVPVVGDSHRDVGKKHFLQNLFLFLLKLFVLTIFLYFFV